ncbi:YdbH domain-containing protein [Chlorobium sp. N1]|uniref:YdbH domain-containing protein n=1 Tax=Chlorobium sp. N1 TaxID=2491138 RepID=UPI001038B132|nr:YdbH domain-containing protein [Chlorobium sp. N1]TCD47443.1 hypothetical protein E0L29_07820 [Chlorobium sp. N1]
MKWLKPLILLIVLLPLVSLAAAWALFPHFAPLLLRPVLESPGRDVRIYGLRRPSFSGIRCDSLTATLDVPPGPCSSDTTHALYQAMLRNPHIGWNAAIQLARDDRELALRITLTADTLSIVSGNGAFRLTDPEPQAELQSVISPNGFSLPAITPRSLTYPITGATLEAGSLKALGISFPLRAEASGGWLPAKETIGIERVENAGAELPLSSIRLRLDALPDSLSHCTLSLSDCSLSLQGMMLSTDTLRYDMRRGRAAFTLQVTGADAKQLQPPNDAAEKTPFATGVLYGKIPVTYADGVLALTGGIVGASGAAALHWYDRTGEEWLSLEAPQGPILRNLNARIGIGGPSGVVLRSLSAELFGGSVKARPLGSSGRSALLTLKDVDALRLVRFHGGFKGSLNGRLNGTVPVSIEPEGFSVRNAAVRSEGGGTVSVTDAQTGEEASYTLNKPAALITRYPSGALTLDFSMKELKRKTGTGELLLANPAGRAMLWHDPAAPDRVRLNNFSAGFFNATLSIREADYDLGTRKGSTVLHFSSLPLQKLLDMQGTRKLYATGTLIGDVPVEMDGALFTITDGGMHSEQSGQIIYATTPEERAAANPGLRITYEALTNFLYIQLTSSLDMRPNGDSVIAVHLKGNNPDYQGGRPVELNLTIRQNLLDLMKSLSISTDIERSISEKALQEQNR